MIMKTLLLILLFGTLLARLSSTSQTSNQSSTASSGVQQLSPKKEEAAELQACAQMVLGGFLQVPNTRDQRFEGKVTEPTARCRGGQYAAQFRTTPWVDWSRYWGAGDPSSLPTGFLSVKGPQRRGVAGALLDLEYQHIELIKFNLFDNSGTYQTFRVRAR